MQATLFKRLTVLFILCTGVIAQVQETSEPVVTPTETTSEVVPVITLAEITATADIVERAVTITAKNNATTTQKPDSLSTSSKGDSDSSDSDAMPTLTKGAKTNTIATPSVTVPPNDNNPYISRSKLPEGTVFIAVGSVLGFLALCVLLWRFAVHMALQRSIKRSELAYGEDKALLQNFMDDSNLDLALSGTTLAGAGGGGGREGLRIGSRPSSRAANTRARMSGIPAQGSLFFSPTADVLHSAQAAAAGSSVGAGGSSVSSSTVGDSAHGHTMSNASTNGQGFAGNTASIRSSTYLPSTYGASGGASVRNVSPGPNRMSMQAHSVMNSTADHIPQQRQRPPSAYLDDLLGHKDSDEE